MIVNCINAVNEATSSYDKTKIMYGGSEQEASRNIYDNQAARLKQNINTASQQF
jgi:hypothetical protein